VLARRLLLRRCTVVLPSRTLWRIARQEWRLPEDRLRYVPNGIDLARFAPRRREGAPGEDPVIGTVAALRNEKNLARLLRAFRLLPEGRGARLVIVGDGPERAGLERLAAELGLGGRVRFTGQVDDPARLYAGFDIFALSSDTEQMPLSVLEAMAAGLPVAATDVGDVRDMLAAENTPFVAPCDEAALAERMRRLLDDPALRAGIGAANRARAERDFDERAMLRAWRGLLEGTA
jgi:glycosyltransferase involved in cell wall biosynthesis